MPRSIELYLNDILTAIGRIEEYVESADANTLVDDKLRLDGILFNLTTVGEAVKHIPEEVRSRNPQANWREAIRFRDRAVHHYFSIDPAIVWEIVSIDLPKLRTQVEMLLHDLRENPLDGPSTEE